MKFFVSCAKGLEYLLADELLALGVPKATATIAGVNADGELVDAQRAVLWSRLASRVLWPIAEFECLNEQALYDGVMAIAWETHTRPELTLAVDAHVSGEAITHARYAAQRVKDAVVDRLRQQGLERPSVDVEQPDVRINLSLRRNRATISIDLGGGPMHRRGWRQAQNEAPLKENLAAAVLMRGGWPALYHEGGALLDPMCGSGTLLIEGALMAADVAPGLQRHGNALPTRWSGFDAAAWRTLFADADLYRALGDALQAAVPQWRASLLCGNADLGYATGLRAAKKYQLFNGVIECALIVCDPVATPAREPREARPLSDGAQMVANRLRKNLKKFKGWRTREGVTCYRAYDADLPEYAAAIDVYEEEGGQHRTFLHVQEYAAPASIPEHDVRRRFSELLAATREVFGVPQEQIAVKARERGKGGSKYGRMQQRDEFIVVRESGALLRVNLFDYLDTGLFLDHRPLRRRMAQEARGKRFLNLFCYTGVASVQAAVAGAASTTSVDLSATYLQWCADNLAENGLGGAKHRLVQADAVRWLEAEQAEYDLVFCDPPTFSNSARADDFDVQKEHVRLLRAAVARLAPGGVLYFSNNFRRFRLDEDAVAEFARYEDISASTIPPDFERNARIHRAWRLTRA